MREWLDWLTRVRLLLVALILAVGVIWPRSVSSPRNEHYFLPLIVFWITLGTIHIIFLRWIPNSRWLGAMQVVGDMAMVSVLVYDTGLHDSYFVSLYLLVIIVGSILFSRSVAFTIAGVCAVMLGGMTVLCVCGEDSADVCERFHDERNCGSGFSTTYLGFWRSRIWRVCWRNRCGGRGSSSRRSGKSWLELQEFTEDIIHSMRGGLITTDIDGRIVLLNRTGEEILGHRFAEFAGRSFRS